MSTASNQSTATPGGSSDSRSRETRALRLARAKEELLQLQLAAARIDTLLAEEEDQNQVSEAVIENDVAKAIKQEEAPIAQVPPTVSVNPNPTLDFPLMKAGGPICFASVVPENWSFQAQLPIFTGSYYEWVSFKLAYRELDLLLPDPEKMALLRQCIKGNARKLVEDKLEDKLENRSSAWAVVNDLNCKCYSFMSCTAFEILEDISLPSESLNDFCFFARQITYAVGFIRELGEVFRGDMYNFARLINLLPPLFRQKYDKFVKTHTVERNDIVYQSSEKLYLIDKFLEQELQSIRKETSKCTDRCDLGQFRSSADFIAINVPQRWWMARKHQLCFKCLQHKVSKHSCSYITCDIDGCKFFHHRLLHCETNLSLLDNNIFIKVAVTVQQPHNLRPGDILEVSGNDFHWPKAVVSATYPENDDTYQTIEVRVNGIYKKLYFNIDGAGK